MSPRPNLGMQPFVRLLRDDGRTLVWWAKTHGVDYSYAARVSNGRVPPAPEMVDLVCKSFGLPPKKCFTRESLAATYRRGRNTTAPGGDAR